MKKKKTRGLFGTNKRKLMSKAKKYIEEYDEYEDEYDEYEDEYEEYEEYDEYEEYESAYEDVEESDVEESAEEYDSEDDYYEAEENDSEEEYYDDSEEYYDDEYYDEEYYDDEYYDEYDYEDEGYERPRGILGWLRSLTAFDAILCAMGILLLAAGGVAISMWVEANMVEQQIEAIIPLGEELSNVGYIGENGIESLEEVLKEQQGIQQTQEQETTEVELETEEAIDASANASAKVNVTFTSTERDLKIRFTDAATGELITGTVFEVVLTNTRGKSFTVQDDDKDGVIYATNVNAGDFQAVVTSTEKYRFPTTGQTVVVKDRIEYVVINVQDEIKTEAQVNVAVEDTENLDAKEEEVILKDTVEWVESGKQLVSGTGVYCVIDKKTIPDPTLTASASVNRLSVGSLAVALNQSALNLYVGEEFKLEGTSYQNSQEGNVTYEYAVEWKSSNSDVATVNNGKVIAKKPGSATISYTVTRKTITTVEPEIEETETAETVETPSETESGSAVESSTEAESSSEAESSTQTESSSETKSDAEAPEEAEQESASVESEADLEEQVAEASVDRLNKAAAAQTTETIETATATCEIKVTHKEASDLETRLKDSNGKQVYIKDSKGNYIEAVYADYFTQKEFYIKVEAQYYYTGWQTINGKTYYYDKSGKPVTGAQVIQGVTYNFGADGAIQNNINGTTFGIDVSKHNGKIDWNAVKSSGVDFAIIRCGYRGSSTGAMIEDPKFHENIKGATAAGIKVGIYFFSQAVDEVEAVKEASMAVSLAKSYHLTYPIFIDTESSGGRGDKISVEQRTAVVNAFCKTVQDAGYKAGVYSSKTWFEKKIDTSGFGNYTIWLAHYADVPSYAGRFDMWQYSCKGTINGISGKVDLNYSYLGY